MTASSEPSERRKDWFKESRLKECRADRIEPSAAAATGARKVMAARGLALLAVAMLGFGLPVTMVLANKSAPLILVLATLTALACAWLEDGALSEVRRRHAAMLQTPVAYGAYGFALVAVLSLTWSIDRAGTLVALVQSLAMAYAGLVAAAVLPLVAVRASGAILVAGLTAAAILVIVEAYTKMGVSALLGQQLAVAQLKRSCDELPLLAWPAWSFLSARGRFLLAGIVALVLLVAMWLAEAGTASLGLWVGGVIVVAGIRWPQRMPALVGGLGLTLLLIAPIAGTLARHVLPERVVALLVKRHAAERMAIWGAFEDHYRGRPWQGYGFDASKRVGEVARPPGQAPSPAADQTIANLHPHNSFLQIWVELGAVGAASAGVLFGLISRGLARVGARGQPARAALFAAALVMAVVGFGLWQAWWSASLGAAIAWFLIVDHDDRRKTEAAGA